MQQDLLVAVALLAHDGGTNLAEPHAMPPALAVQTETGWGLLHVESRAKQMALAERTAYLEFFANGEGLLRAYYLEFPDAPALATLQWDEVGDSAKVILEFFVDES